MLAPSSLPERVAAAYGVPDAAGVMEIVTGRGAAALALSLGAPATRLRGRGRRARARSASVWVARENAAYLRAGARACGLGEPTPVTLAGGVMRHSSPLLTDALAEALPGLRAAPRPPRASRGALLAALDEGGAAPCAGRHGAARGSLHDRVALPSVDSGRPVRPRYCHPTASKERHRAVHASDP